jgi:hypothetical protein
MRGEVDFDFGHFFIHPSTSIHPFSLIHIFALVYHAVHLQCDDKRGGLSRFNTFATHSKISEHQKKNGIYMCGPESEPEFKSHPTKKKI